MAVSITRRFTFDAGHRIFGHESKCKHLHGHTYHVELSVSSPELDSLGRVVDFGVLKTLVGSWIDSDLDHNLLLNSDDPIAPDNLDPFMVPILYNGKFPYLFKGVNPTAENIAKEIYHASRIMLPEHISVVSVVVHETPNCRACYYE